MTFRNLQWPLTRPLTLFCNPSFGQSLENIYRKSLCLQPCLFFSCGSRTSFNMLVFFSFAGTLRFCGLFHSSQPDLLPHEGQLHSGNEWTPRTQHSILHTREWNASFWRGNQQVHPESNQCYGGGPALDLDLTSISCFFPIYSLSISKSVHVKWCHVTFKPLSYMLTNCSIMHVIELIFFPALQPILTSSLFQELRHCIFCHLFLQTLPNLTWWCLNQLQQCGCFFFCFNYFSSKYLHSSLPSPIPIHYFSPIKHKVKIG